MSRITFSSSIAGTLFLLCLATVPAEATVDHTYVSGKGTDTGGCATPAAACRTFAYAITQTSASGIIIVIDPADYAPVTITKSISIVADGGGPAGIFGGTGTAITINAGSAVVNLRGLTLDGEGTAAFGIALGSAGSLTITDCVVRHFTLTGINLTPSGTLNFHILNTISSDSNIGLSATASAGGAVQGVVDRFTATHDGGGIAIGPLAVVSVLNSVLSNNSAGLGVSGTNATVSVRNSVANNNTQTGFSAGAQGIMRLANSMAIGNSQAGISIAYATVFSYGDNEINGNGTDVSGGTLTSVAKR
ncbi:MAG: hypothetical protein WA231_23275 [Methylocella sp.]